MGSVQNPNDSTALPPDPYYPYVGLEVPMSPDDWSAMEVIKGRKENTPQCVIPTNLTSLSLLIGLNLSNNHLIGAIPPEIGKMVKLESLDLSSNHLSGTIPDELVIQQPPWTNPNRSPASSSLTFLSRMNLS
ncbi:hypothetical protein V2J09_008373 [Rumex salicifolius]